MKKIIVLIVVLILSFVGFKYWEKSSYKISSAQTQSPIAPNSIERNSVNKSNEKLPCLDAAINFLTIKEINKQDSELCGYQKRFEQYSNSQLISTVYGVSMKCLIDDAVNNGFTASDAKKYTEMYIAEGVSKRNADKMNKDRNITCNALNAVLTAYGS